MCFHTWYARYYVRMVCRGGDHSKVIRFVPSGSFGMCVSSSGPLFSISYVFVSCPVATQSNPGVLWLGTKFSGENVRSPPNTKYSRFSRYVRSNSPMVSTWGWGRRGNLCTGGRASRAVICTLGIQWEYHGSFIPNYGMILWSSFCPWLQLANWPTSTSNQV